MNLKYGIGILAVMLSLTGCKPGNQPPTPSTPPPPTAQNQAVEPQQTVTGEQVKQEAKKTAALTQQYVMESKDEAVTAMQKDLQEMDAKLADLKDKSKDYTNAAKTNADAALATLSQERDTAAAKLEQLKAASEDKWKDVKAGFDSTMDDLKQKYKDFKSKF